MTSSAADVVGAGAGVIAVRASSGVLVAGRVRVATGFWARFRGLMGVRSLDAQGGLYLPVNSIHMLFMRFDIDAVFVSDPDPAGDRRVIAVHAALPAWRGLVMPVRGAAGVLELPAGAAARVGLGLDDAVRFEVPEPD